MKNKKSTWCNQNEPSWASQHRNIQKDVATHVNSWSLTITFWEKLQVNIIEEVPISFVWSFTKSDWIVIVITSAKCLNSRRRDSWFSNIFCFRHSFKNEICLHEWNTLQSDFHEYQTPVITTVWWGYGHVEAILNTNLITKLCKFGCFPFGLFDET